MTVSFPFQQQFTWRKLGYLYFSNSTDYRTVLEQNPQWKVTTLPPVGAQIRISSSVSGNGGVPGGLTQSSFIFGLDTNTAEKEIFPFDTREEYNLSLNRYTLQGVIDRESINGITFDSVQAITGSQSG